jgi:hypothetical protein
LSRGRGKAVENVLEEARKEIEMQKRYWEEYEIYITAGFVMTFGGR